MRNTPNVRAERYRVREGIMASDSSYGNNGAFSIPLGKPSGKIILNVIVSDEEGWDHVSVSLPNRCPMWDEMCAIKELFFTDEETVIQYHPPKSAYINQHPFCLHLWRSQKTEILLPPAWTIGLADSPKPTE